MKILDEGKAKFYASVDKSGKISKELDVFYNPVMKFNRDVSVLILNALNMKDMQIADVMAGSGVRSLRFLKELKKGIIKCIAVNDYDKGFQKLFAKELKLNDIRFDKKSMLVSGQDANIFMLESSGFDYIDIDPFGSPNDFLESSISRLSRRGILAVTATDTAPLSGTYPDACKRKYWAVPLHNHLMHEVGLRILIRRVQFVGASHDKALTPIYSYFKDHYFRVFFKCEKSKSAADAALAMHRYMLSCNKCLYYKVSETNNGICECGAKMQFAGPMWTGKLYDSQLADTISRLNKNASNTHFLKIIADESHNDIVGFYDIHAIAKKYHSSIPKSDSLIEKIKIKYDVTRTHFTPLGIRSDIPINLLVDIMRKL